MSKKLYITGTGTDVGKTYVTGLILKRLKENQLCTAYYKAAVSGNERGRDGKLLPGDAMHVKEVSKIGQPLEEMCPYIYEKAVSPHLAARMEKQPVELSVVLGNYHHVCSKYEYVTVEGSGGIICPLRFDNEKLFLADVIKALDIDCLLVADAGLGTINSVVLTAEYMKAQEIPLKGIIFNHYQPGNILHEDNIAMCEYLTGVKAVACVKTGDTDLDISLEELKALYR